MPEARIDLEFFAFRLVDKNRCRLLTPLKELELSANAPLMAEDAQDRQAALTTQTVCAPGETTSGWAASAYVTKMSEIFHTLSNLDR